MEDWCLSTADVPSFEALFSRLRRPPPADRTASTKTQAPDEFDINVSGSQLEGFGRLSFENLVLSNDSDHGLVWAIDRLRAYGPLPNPRFNIYWDPGVPVLPSQIRSERNTTKYVMDMLIEPAVAAAVFIRAQHLGLTAAQGTVYPERNWELDDCSTDGPGSGRADYALVRSLPTSTSDRFYVAMMEFKTWHVCHSNGEDLDGRRPRRIPVIERLPQWLEGEHGYITMDPPNSNPRQPKQFNYYGEAWKKKLQMILFQCWHSTVTRNVRHCVLANEREFILLLRSGHDFLLSKRYSFHPSTPQDTLEMMTHVSYFLAHALCERFPVNDDDFRLPDPLPAIHAESDAASSSSPSSPSSPSSSSGTFSTHARTDSQATIRGPVNAAMMRLAKGLIRVLSTGCTASSVTFNLMGYPSPPLALTLVHGQGADFFPKQPCTISISRAVQWGDRRHVFRGRFGGMPVVAKICSDGTQSLLLEEYAIYQTLSDLQGSAIPRCYGLFRVEDMADMLLLEDCGESLQSFDGLTAHQRASLLSHVSAIHRRHVAHQDLEPRNIVKSATGQLRVVDFELSDRSHRCVPQDCKELQDLAWESKGGPLRDVSGHLVLAAMVAGVVVIVYLAAR